MVVMYALAVTKQKLTPKHSKETQMEVSVQILIAFSCLEYFRHIRLAEYLDTVRAVLPSVQENESACVTFVESIPSYADLTVGQGKNYLLFYLSVRLVPSNSISESYMWISVFDKLPDLFCIYSFVRIRVLLVHR